MQIPAGGRLCLRNLEKPVILAKKISKKQENMNLRTLALPLFIVAVAGGGYLTWRAVSGESGNVTNNMEITMYRGAACNCCVDWAKYLEAEGLAVIDEIVDDLVAFKEEMRVPRPFYSCHTAVIGGYVVEGHIPAEEIRRMIDLQPDAIGIAVPGMPAGSPGMEIGFSAPYQVLLFDDQNYSVFAEY